MCPYSSHVWQSVICRTFNKTWLYLPRDARRQITMIIIIVTRKCGNCECIATWGRPTPRQSSPAIITTQCQVWSRSTYPLPYYSVFAPDALLYIVTLTLTLNICNVSPVTWWNSVPNLNAIEQSAVELLRVQCLTLWPWTLRYVLRSALG